MSRKHAGMCLLLRDSRLKIAVYIVLHVSNHECFFLGLKQT